MRNKDENFDTSSSKILKFYRSLEKTVTDSIRRITLPILAFKTSIHQFRVSSLKSRRRKMSTLSTR